MEKKATTIERTLSPYDYDCADDVFSILFCKTGYVTEDGLTEIPAASYQLIVSALELMRWEVTGSKNRDAFKSTISLVERLRDCQKMREWKRQREQKELKEGSGV